MKRLGLKPRFMSYVSAVPEAGCWLWLAKIDKYGYGDFWMNGKGVKAHRAAYELFNGTIPENMSVLHSCDVRCCVNPYHLFLGFPKDNSADMTAKGRQAKGSKVGGAKLEESKVVEILASNEKSSVLAKNHGVSHAAIWWIRTGKTWKHVKGAES